MNRIFRVFSLLLCFMILFGAGAAENPETITPLPSPSESAAPAYSLLKSGSSGEEVKALQNRLHELGYDPGEIDGIYGAGTKTAVKSFQKLNGLEADGMAGRETQKILFSDSAIPAPLPAEPVDVISGDLPCLVNKEHPVQEDFVPADLVYLKDVCPSDLVRIKYDSIQGVSAAAEALVAMLEAAKNEGIKKWQVSAGYRSYVNQENLLNNKIESYLKKNSGWSRSRARSAALKTVAEPGASEHHLGLAFDVNVPGASSFASTKQCKWLHAHCWEYGFIIRYQKGKESITGFTAEAWHIRYVGTEHSLIMRDLNLCLEEYLEQAGNEVIENEEPE